MHRLAERIYNHRMWCIPRPVIIIVRARLKLTMLDGSTSVEGMEPLNELTNNCRSTSLGGSFGGRLPCSRLSASSRSTYRSGIAIGECCIRA